VAEVFVRDCGCQYETVPAEHLPEGLRQYATHSRPVLKFRKRCVPHAAFCRALEERDLHGGQITPP
jgi:hypothetical protein